MEFNYYSISHLRNVKSGMKFNGLMITLKYVLNVLLEPIRWCNLILLIRDYVNNVQKDWSNVWVVMILKYCKDIGEMIKIQIWSMSVFILNLIVLEKMSAIKALAVHSARSVTTDSIL